VGYVLPRFANTPRFFNSGFKKALLGNCAMEHPIVDFIHLIGNLLWMSLSENLQTEIILALYIKSE
jgi:hypothetical protein